MATTVLDTETDVGEDVPEGMGSAAASVADPQPTRARLTAESWESEATPGHRTAMRSRSRSRNRSRASAQVIRIRSPGQLPVLPVATEGPPVRTGNTAVEGAPARTGSTALVEPIVIADDSLQSAEQTAGDASVDPFNEESPWSGTLRMNGSTMDDIWEAPPQPSGSLLPRFSHPGVQASCLPKFSHPGVLLPPSWPIHFHGAGLGSAMGICAGQRAALVCNPLEANAKCISGDCTGIEEGWRHALGRVRRIADGGVAFYIGITEDPGRRWEEHLLERHWDEMVVLIRAPSSHATAELEIRLIEHFSGSFGCQNLGRGGEGRSAGSPHFLYVLVRHSALLRRGR